MALSSIFTAAAEAIATSETNRLLLLVALPAFFILRWIYYENTTQINVPSMGVPPGIFGRLKAGRKWQEGSQHLISEGMAKYGKFGKPFKVRHPLRWLVCLTDPDMIKELKSLPPAVVSFHDAVDQLMRTDFAFNPGMMKDDWHSDIVRKKLADSLIRLLPEIVNEVAAVWMANTKTIGDEWTEVVPFEAFLKMVSRTTNRVLVGLPLSQNDEFLDTILGHSVKVVTTSTILDRTPGILQPLAAWWFLEKEKTVSKALTYMGPVWEDRIKNTKNGKWIGSGEKPNDVFQWILEAAPLGTSVRKMTIRFFLFNFASIHTTSFTMAHAVFDLAANPSFQQPLVDEIETQLREAGGWSQKSLAGMKRLDSVLRESARLNGANICTMMRKVITPYTFSDGTHVTKGDWVAAAASSINRWDKNYSSPDVFDGFRFYNMRQVQGSADKFQNTTTSTEFLAWGHGEFACPGRYFATHQLKVMLAHVLCNYEFKFAEGKGRPENAYQGVFLFPDMSAEILIRKRKPVVI